MLAGEIMVQTNKPPTGGSDLMEPPPISALVMADSSATKKSQTDHDNACAQQNCSKTNHC
jgi:hypothetical protein